MRNWHSLQLLQAGHLLGSSVPMASEEIISDGVKQVLLPSTLAVVFSLPFL
jgi:hypothetical protein